MPLTKEELKKVQARLGTGTQQSQPALPGTLPPQILQQLQGLQSPQPYLSGVTGKSPRITVPQSQEQVARELQIEALKQQMKNVNPVLTETERERSPMAQSSVAFLDQFATDLGITAEDGKALIKHPEKIAPSFSRELIPQKFQDYALSEDSSIVYNALESAFQLGSVVLTGRQGDLQKLQQIRDVYTFGGGIKGKPRLALQRYQNLRKLFQTFDRIGTASGDQQQTLLNQVNQQMDTLLAGTPSAPELSPSAQSLIKRYRRK